MASLRPGCSVLIATLSVCEWAIIMSHWLHLISSVPIRALSYLSSVISPDHSPVPLFPPRRFHLRIAGHKMQITRAMKVADVQLRRQSGSSIPATPVSERLSSRAHGGKHAHAHSTPHSFTFFGHIWAQRNTKCTSVVKLSKSLKVASQTKHSHKSVQKHLNA